MLQEIATPRELIWGLFPCSEPATMRLSSTILAAAACILFSACSSAHYRITLKDGRDFVVASQPEYVQKTGYYRYRDLLGKDALVRADEVLFIREQ